MHGAWIMSTLLIEVAVQRIEGRSAGLRRLACAHAYRTLAFANEFRLHQGAAAMPRGTGAETNA
jgi:hypothetical protein